jgi:hypothetical protein
MSEQEVHPPRTATDERTEESASSHERPDEPAVESDGPATSTGYLAALDARMHTLRETPTQRRLALGVAVVIGLPATIWHWFGLVLGGALVGLTRQSLRRALAAGFGFGCLVLTLFLATLQLSAGITPTELGALAPLSTLSVGFTLLAPTWGALLRGAI